MSSAPAEAREIFTVAIEQYSPEQWSSYLDQACGENLELRKRVELLLEAHVGEESVLDSPAIAPPPSIVQPIPEKPGTHIGPYKLLQQIGEGGMGVVYMAEQHQPVRRKVAVKIMKPGMDTRQVIARFEAERQALALMDHPNIARVFDGGTTGEARGQKSAVNKGDGGSFLTSDACPLTSGRPYFVMELVKGVPITHYCDENRLTPRERLELFVPVCQAIQHAHTKGIIHRDIKPGNVLVAPYDGRPVPKVIDFGVAKATGQRLTERTLFTGLGAVVGTLEYMSPEQAELNNQDVDTRTDIYSLGVLLYELLTGTTPLNRQRLKQVAFTEMLRVIREEDPPRPSTRLSESKGTLPSISAQRHMEPGKLTKLLRGELDWIAMKALEKERNRRYETASALAQDVQRYLADDPVQACPPSVGYRLRKLLRRHKGPVVAVGLVLLALITGVIGTTWGMLRAEQQRRVAEANELQARAAAAAEERAKENAQSREAETRAVLDFVEDKVFAAARPEGVGGGLGREVSLRKALETALPFVKESFTDQPLIEARLRCTLARSFALLGDAKSALQLVEPAEKLYSRHCAPDDPDRLRCMCFLAATYLALGRPVDAVTLHEETLARQKARLGSEHNDTLVSMHHLAVAYRALGRKTKALRLCEEALTLREATLGPEHRETLRSMHDLANSYEGLGRIDEALKLHLEILAKRRAKFGPDDRDTLYSMHEAACCYWALGRHADARKFQDQRLAIMKAKFGPDHPETIAGMYHLALVLFDQGQHAEAIELHEQTLALTIARFGLDHPHTLATMNTLAANYLTAGRHDDARKLLDESLKRVAVKDVDPGLQRQLISVRLRYFEKMKDAAGCRAAAEMFEKLQRTDGDSLYEAACMRAVIAAVIGASDKSATAGKDAAVEADLAMAWLKKAIAAGYKDVEHIMQDTDLDALRDREDFKKLVGNLQAGKAKVNK